MTRVLGLDAGANTGWAAMHVDTRGIATRLDSGVLERDHREPEMQEFLRRFEPQLVAVEIPEGHAYAGRHVAMKHLVEAAAIGALLAGFALALGYDVVTTNAAVVRRALNGKGNASNRDVATMLRLRCPGWPKRSSNHERDAAAVAIWGVVHRLRAAAEACRVARSR